MFIIFLLVQFPEIIIYVNGVQIIVLSKYSSMH